MAVADEKGWEECVLASLNHLCRTCLAKGAADSVGEIIKITSTHVFFGVCFIVRNIVTHTKVNPAALSFPDDINKLRKAIVSVCERLRTSKIVAQ